MARYDQTPAGAASISYRNATFRRTDYPLFRGRYKLEEACNTLARLLATLREYRTRLDSGLDFRDSESLGQCLAFERTHEIRKYPDYIASVLGYDAMPALRALCGDGLAVEQTRGLADEAEDMIAPTLARLDLLHRKLSQLNERNEARVIAGAGRELADLLSSCISALSDLLVRAAEPWGAAQL